MIFEATFRKEVKKNLCRYCLVPNQFHIFGKYHFNFLLNYSLVLLNCLSILCIYLSLIHTHTKTLSLSLSLSLRIFLSLTYKFSPSQMHTLSLADSLFYLFTNPNHNTFVSIYIMCQSEFFFLLTSFSYFHPSLL